MLLLPAATHEAYPVGVLAEVLAKVAEREHAMVAAAGPSENSVSHVEGHARRGTLREIPVEVNKVVTGISAAAVPVAAPVGMHVEAQGGGCTSRIPPSAAAPSLVSDPSLLAAVPVVVPVVVLAAVPVEVLGAGHAEGHVVVALVRPGVTSMEEAATGPALGNATVVWGAPALALASEPVPVVVSEAALMAELWLEQLAAPVSKGQLVLPVAVRWEEYFAALALPVRPRDRPVEPLGEQKQGHLVV